MSLGIQLCERCGAETHATTTSMFNTQTICMDCKRAEKRHPQYQAAVEAEGAACRSGNYNFPGIGLPADLEKS